jgi:hypothetical protein
MKVIFCKAALNCLRLLVSASISNGRLSKILLPTQTVPFRHIDTLGDGK